MLYFLSALFIVATGSLVLNVLACLERHSSSRAAIKADGDYLGFLVAAYSVIVLCIIWGAAAEGGV